MEEMLRKLTDKNDKTAYEFAKQLGVESVESDRYLAMIPMFAELLQDKSFETVKYHNAVFVGYDKDGKARYATLVLMEKDTWNDEHLISLAGVFQTKRVGVVPVALEQFLNEHEGITTIHLHLDNDEVGRGATEGIMLGLPGKYTVLDEPPALGCKDVNDQLKQTVGIIKKRNTFER